MVDRRGDARAARAVVASLAAASVVGSVALILALRVAEETSSAFRTMAPLVTPPPDSAADRARPPVAEATSPLAFVEQARHRLATLSDANAPAAEIDQALDGMIDHVELARRALGKPCPAATTACVNHWDELTGEQQRELAGLMRQVVDATIRKNARELGGYRFVDQTQQPAGGNVTVVRTEAKRTPREASLTLDYVVRESGGTYALVDLVVEGSSVTRNYYAQFHRMLTTTGQGYSFLARKLLAKLEMGR
jgi:ABC-type transporter MlaC component